MSTSHTGKFPAIADAVAAEDLPHLKGMGRRERRAAETRVRLFRCATQLFAKRGFPNVTVEDITEAADVGKGTFFNYFKSKEHVFGVMAEIQLGKVREALAQAEVGKQSIQTIVHRMFYRVAEEPGRSADLTRALISAVTASERVRIIMSDRMAEGRRMLARVFELGQERGEVAPELKPAQMAMACQQSVMGTLLLWCLRGEGRLQSWLENSFDHFWRAITPHRGSSS
jgi:AcrR family transcriptional regulator